MKLNLCVMEVQGQRYIHFLYDIIKNVQLGLQTLGHSCTLRKNFIDRSRVNIIFGAHTLTSIADARAIIETKAPYVIFQTEVIQDNQVLHAGPEHWRSIYLPLLMGAIRIWDWAEVNLALYRTWGKEGDLIITGFHPDMEVIRPAKDRPIDALYCGSVTEHRKRLLEKMARKGLRLHVAFDDIAFYRNDLMAHSKVVLSLQQVPGGPLNGQRAMFAANNRLCCAGEWGESPDWILELLQYTNHEAVPDLVEDVVKHQDYVRLGQEAYEKFREHPTSGLIELAVEHLAQSLAERKST